MIKQTYRIFYKEYESELNYWEINFVLPEIIFMKYGISDRAAWHWRDNDKSFSLNLGFSGDLEKTDDLFRVKIFIFGFGFEATHCFGY